MSLVPRSPRDGAAALRGVTGVHLDVERARLGRGRKRGTRSVSAAAFAASTRVTSTL